MTRTVFGRIREGELKLAKSILRWRLQKEGKAVPPEAELDSAAGRLLEESRQIARQRGRNLYEILKEEANRIFG